MIALFKNHHFWAIVVSIALAIIIPFEVEGMDLPADHRMPRIFLHVWLFSLAFCLWEGTAFSLRSSRQDAQDRIQDRRTEFLNRAYAGLYRDFVRHDSRYGDSIRLIASRIPYQEDAFKIANALLIKMHGGVLTVDCEIPDYFIHLETTLAHARRTILLTCVVPPHWFFEPDDSALQPHERADIAVPQGTKQKILDLIEGQRVGGGRKIRLVIFDEHDRQLLKDDPGMPEKYRTGSIRLVTEQQSLEHFFTDEKLLSSEHREHVVEDYMVFDDCYALQYNFARRVLLARWSDESIGLHRQLFDNIPNRLTGKFLFKTFSDWHQARALG